MSGPRGADTAGAGGQVRIRPATPDDVDLIYAFIVELAEYERAPEEVTGTPELLAESLFGAAPSAEALIAELDGTPAGFAVFHGTFSTWECRPGIWLEDLYVPERFRRAGIGRALLRHLAAVTVERGCTRLEWTALDWNTPALAFYEGLGASRLSAWELHRLDGEALRRVAAG
ncbi:MAG TPA: GNAT family N-acetyltransferase [Solirubrobacteraceae bacterium]|nr:GNAT family N-acetyltransferase [Solirubrobacteraceae bacterium]